MNECEWIDYISKLGPTVVALVAAIIVVVGWFVNSRKALNNQIEKEARKYRIEMCMAVIEFHKYFNQLVRENNTVPHDGDELFKLFEDMMSKILLYGGNKENILIRELASNFRVAAENSGQKNMDEAMSHFNISSAVNELFSISIKRFRKELRLEKISERKIKPKEGVK
jgi:hypothetical protein